MKKLPKITQNFLCYEPNMDRSYRSVFPVIFEPIESIGRTAKVKLVEGRISLRNKAFTVKSV